MLCFPVSLWPELRVRNQQSGISNHDHLTADGMDARLDKDIEPIEGCVLVLEMPKDQKR